MDSSHIRILLAVLFVAFLVVVLLSDLVRRKPKPRKPIQRQHGFRSADRAPPPPGTLSHRGWKAGPRR
jgi:hypothetical protein